MTSISIHAREPLTRLGRRLREERGQSLVEFAIVLPVLILIILGILYFGRYEDYANQETQLAESGVRWAAVNYTPASGTLASYIQQQAQPELRNGSNDVTAMKIWIYQPTTATYQVGQPVRVCVQTNVTFPTPIGAPQTAITEVATMRIEQTSSTASSLPYSNTSSSAYGNSSTTLPSKCPTT